VSAAQRPAGSVAAHTVTPGRSSELHSASSSGLQVLLQMAACSCGVSPRQMDTMRDRVRTVAGARTTIAPAVVHSTTCTLGSCMSTWHTDPPSGVGFTSTSTGHRCPTRVHSVGTLVTLATGATSVRLCALNARCRRRLRICLLRMTLQNVFATFTQLASGTAVFGSGHSDGCGLRDMDGRTLVASVVLCGMVLVPAASGNLPAFGHSDDCGAWFRCVYGSPKKRENVIRELTAAIGTPTVCDSFNSRFAHAVAALPASSPDRCTDSVMVTLVADTGCQAEAITPPCHNRSHGVHISTTALFMLVLGISGFINAYQILGLFKKRGHDHDA
jgi:hypothetical protein